MVGVVGVACNAIAVALDIALVLLEIGANGNRKTGKDCKSLAFRSRKYTHIHICGVCSSVKLSEDFEEVVY